ncbi:MAG TPA: hypothetical protein VH331_13870 [Allosphingosinicella sp.]|jgi:hypothetical protein|nr:hypothetical protein [Allosphingosinicella sp.]
MRFLLFTALVLLAACHKADEENIQARAEKDSAQLQQRYNALQAEASNDADAQAAPIDNEAANLLNQMNGAVPAAANGAAPGNGT